MPGRTDAVYKPPVVHVTSVVQWCTRHPWRCSATSSTGRAAPSSLLPGLPSVPSLVHVSFRTPTSWLQMHPVIQRDMGVTEVKDLVTHPVVSQQPRIEQSLETQSLASVCSRPQGAPCTSSFTWKEHVETLRVQCMRTLIQDGKTNSGATPTLASSASPERNT